jgi:hypothetical protein
LRKLAAILLLVLLGFTQVGYKLYFHFAFQQSDHSILARIEAENYKEEDVITITAPLSLPYHTDWPEFERVNGEITIEGKVYKYIKRRIVNGQLVLQCLRDENKGVLTKVKNDFIQSSTDLPVNATDKKPPHSKSFSLKNIGTEYISQKENWLVAFYTVPLHTPRPVNEMIFSSLPADPSEQPPDSI